MQNVLRTADRGVHASGLHVPVFINNTASPRKSASQLPVLNPANGEKVGSLDLGTPADVDMAVDAARSALSDPSWATMRPFERGHILRDIADRIREDGETLGRLESLDVGKPISQARADVEAAARYFEYYGGLADKVTGASFPVAPHLLTWTTREPIGVTAHIIPFNYPLQNTARGVAPALAAGCTAVVKPAPECSVTPFRIAEIAQQAGLPAGVLNVVPGLDDVGAHLSAHPGVDHITFTGSVEAGSSVAANAARNIVPTVLELGGKSPTIVFGDADFQSAARMLLASVYNNAGQTCSAGARLLLEEGSEGDEFLAILLDRVRRMSIGPGLEDPDIGPLVSEKQRDRVLRILDESKTGVKILTGGGPPDVPELQNGYFIAPTICLVENDNVPIAHEEVFGPVLTVARFSGRDGACKIANATPYGLAAYVWTRDQGNATFMARGVRAGQVHVNAKDVGTSIELPFGGYKRSGWGREKGLLGIESYLQHKTICMGVG